MIDKKTASFVQSLCMGQIEEQIVVPYPEMKAPEKETLGQVLASVNQLLSPRERDFREWDVRGEMPRAFVEELKAFGLFGLVNQIRIGQTQEREFRVGVEVDASVGVAVSVVWVGLLVGGAWQPINVAETPWMMQSIVTSPFPLQSNCGQRSNGSVPRAMLTPFTSSSTVTL